MKQLKGRVVKFIEEEQNINLTEKLIQYEKFYSPMWLIAKELNVSLGTIYYWRQKLGFKRRNYKKGKS